MKTAEITIGATIQGVEDVQSGFEQMGDSAEQMGDKIAESGTRAGVGYSTLLRNQASVMTQSLSMAHILDEVAKGHTNLAMGMIMLIPHMERMAASIFRIVTAHGAEIAVEMASIGVKTQHAAASIASAVAEGVQEAATWLLTAATKAYAIAQAIADALTPVGWAILAGAAAAAAVGVSLAMTIPSKEIGGPIPTTGQYLLHAGEYVIPSGKGAGIVNYVEINDPVFRSRGDLDYLVGRLKRMGMA